jgi:phage FluMu protein gp41
VAAEAGVVVGQREAAEVVAAEVVAAEVVAAEVVAADVVAAEQVAAAVAEQVAVAVEDLEVSLAAENGGDRLFRIGTKRRA